MLASAVAATAMAGSPSNAGTAERLVSVVSTDQRTGKLVRSVVPTTRRETPARSAVPAAPPKATPGPPATVTAIAEAVERAAAQHSLPPALLHSVIKVESNYNPSAVSPKGAQGLMQLIPSTALRFGVSDVFDPADNIQGGAKYLRYLLDLYHGDYPLALAAYNAGEGAVAKYGTVPPYPETQNYLRLVARQLRESAPAPVEKQQPPAAPAVTQVAQDDTRHVQAVVGEDGSLRFVSQ
jgi:soluble lytic murein transglycosylase-like protein